MDRPLGLFLTGFNYAEASEDKFNEWCDSQFMAERRQQQGFINAHRWIGVNDPKDTVVTFDLSNLEAVKASGCASISSNGTVASKLPPDKCKTICCFEAQQTLPGTQPSPDGAGALLVAAMNIKPAYEEEFNAWYDEEHIPYLAAVPGTLCARRFKTTKGTQKSLAIYHLESPDVFTSAAFKTAVETPWTHRLRPHTSDRYFILLRPYGKNHGSPKLKK